MEDSQEVSEFIANFGSFESVIIFWRYKARIPKTETVTRIVLKLYAPT